MTRTPDPAKKPALLESIVDYLIDKPLGALTFRSLATALGVTPFTLVYHFGNRDDLVRDIIEAIATRQKGFETVFDPKTVTVESYLEGLRETFETSLLPRNVALQRLEFEAEMLEVASPGHALTRVAHASLQERAQSTLAALGLEPENAAEEAQLLLDTFYGIQISLVISGDHIRATKSFNRALGYHAAMLAPHVVIDA